MGIVLLQDTRNSRNNIPTKRRPEASESEEWTLSTRAELIFFHYAVTTFLFVSEHLVVILTPGSTVNHRVARPAKHVLTLLSHATTKILEIIWYRSWTAVRGKKTPKDNRCLVPEEASDITQG